MTIKKNIGSFSFHLMGGFVLPSRLNVFVVMVILLYIKDDKLINLQKTSYRQKTNTGKD